jgi:hypothetical protein
VLKKCPKFYLQVVHYSYPGAPLKPQFENVIVTATLDDFVTSVIADVIVLVLLEQVVCRHLVTADQKPLKQKNSVIIITI